MNTESVVSTPSSLMHFETLTRDLDIATEAEEHFRNAHTLEELLYGWCTRSRSTRVCNGTSDHGLGEVFFVILTDEKEEVAAIEVPLKYLRERFPEVQSALDYEFEEEDFPDRKPCAEIPEYILTPSDILKFVTAYVLTGAADISIGHPDSFFFECWEKQPEELFPNQLLLSANFFYQDEQTGKGFGENRWMVWNAK